jgi:hypothetical protein
MNRAEIICNSESVVSRPHGSLGFHPKCPDSWIVWKTFGQDWKKHPITTNNNNDDDDYGGGDDDDDYGVDDDDDDDEEEEDDDDKHMC